MKKGKLVIAAVAICFVAAGVVFGTKSIGKVNASAYDHGYSYQFEDMHMQNIYAVENQDNVESDVAEAQETSEIVFELFVSEEYAGYKGKIYANLCDYETGKYVGNVFFEKTREENGGFIYTVNITQPVGSHLRATVYNTTNYDYIIDDNGGHGYELKF